MVAIICFGIAISIAFLVIAALNAKPSKPVKSKYQSKLKSVLPPNPYLNQTYEEMIAERKKLRPIVQPDPKPKLKPPENNFGKVINYDQGHGAKREQIKEEIPEITEVIAKQRELANESKLEQARRLDVLHELFRKEKQQQSPEKRDISAAKLRILTKMVNGHKDVALRLIDGNLKRFPDKSPDWACDKAISDLERDRRT
jgi:hypothetical protein